MFLTFGVSLISRPVTDNNANVSPIHLTSCDEIFEIYPKYPRDGFAQWPYSNLPESHINITNIELIGDNCCEVTVHFKSDHNMSLIPLSELRIMTSVNTFMFFAYVKLITNPGDFTYAFTVSLLYHSNLTGAW